MRHLLLLLAFRFLCAGPIQQQGYVEICNQYHGAETFDRLYTLFDEFTVFLQENPTWGYKFCAAKERFIRSKERNYYSTNFFGLYDESQKRSLISFYYSSHFHQFISLRFPELHQIPQIGRFLDLCYEIAQPYDSVFKEAATFLGVPDLFPEQIPILFKVLKYLPSYTTGKPHFDGTAMTLFLDSTDNSSLLLSSYRSSFATEDFYSPERLYQNSSLLIPGVFLRQKDYPINPTPHVIIRSGVTRYAAVAFAMLPNHTQKPVPLTSLPNFIRM